MWPFSSYSSAVLAALDRSLAVIEFEPNGKIVTANANFLKVLGYELGEIVGKHHSMFVDTSEVKTEAYATFWRELAAGRYQSAEFKRIGKGGREVWIQATYNPVLDKSGKVIRVMKFATDITARKLADADAHGQIAAINHAQAVISFKPDGTVIDANDNFLNAFGYRLDEIVGKHHSTFVPSEDRNTADYRAFWDELRAGKFKTDEFRRIGKAGNDVYIQATYNPIFDMAGRLIKVTKFATDITAAVTRRKARQTAQAEISRDLSEVAGMVARSNMEAEGANGIAATTASNVQAVAAGAEELAASVAEISRQVSVALSVSEEAVTQAEMATKVVSGLATRRPEDRPSGGTHQQHCRSDQLARPQCHHRSGAGRRDGQGLRRRCLGGQAVGRADIEGHRRDRRGDRRRAADHFRGGVDDRRHIGDHYPHQRRFLVDRQRGRGAGGRDAGHVGQHADGRPRRREHRHFPGRDQPFRTVDPHRHGKPAAGGGGHRLSEGR